MSDPLGQEFERQRAERKRLRELDVQMRLESEAAVRALLDEFYPAGVPDELVERICQVQNGLIKRVIRLEGVTRELHDGINRIGDESFQRWMNGFRECADQVRAHAIELKLAPVVVDSLLRNDIREEKTTRWDKDQAATQQVVWKRG